MGKIKEATEVEADFATSQAPWNKLMKRQEKTKLKYYDLSKKVRRKCHPGVFVIFSARLGSSTVFSRGFGSID